LKIASLLKFFVKQLFVLEIANDDRQWKVYILQIIIFKSLISFA